MPSPSRPSIIVTQDGKQNCRCSYCLALINIVFKDGVEDFLEYDRHRRACRAKNRQNAEAGEE